MSVFTPRLEVLPPEQRSLWPELAPAAGLGLALVEAVRAVRALPEVSVLSRRLGP